MTHYYYIRSINLILFIKISIFGRCHINHLGKAFHNFEIGIIFVEFSLIILTAPVTISSIISFAGLMSFMEPATLPVK